MLSSAVTAKTVEESSQINKIEDKYHTIGLEGVMDFDLFKDAYEAYKSTDTAKKPVLTIIDYKRPSTEKRFFVIDLEKEELAFETYVAHGVNSGGKTATEFSNIMSSRQTSLGVFVTNETYYGNHGYSLRLDGVSDGLNDKARDRHIVVHAADYATKEFINKHGYLGRSWGCPALSPEVNKEVIDMIKGGSVIYASA
ncbi:murein L,D-transpeptidase catalytic domain family protein [Vibrio inusitatus]|nr:murein L,D-transpeptidase catalytic domain family protein [Vibrio inusitatus]